MPARACLASLPELESRHPARRRSRRRVLLSQGPDALRRWTHDKRTIERSRRTGYFIPGSPETTQQVIREVQAEGTCWCGKTVWQGQTAMRMSVSSWATTDGDVERSLDAMLRIAGRYSRGQ